MSWKLTWHNENPYYILEGYIDFEELNNANNFIIGHKNFDLMKFQLWDLSNVSNFDITKQEMKIIGTLDKKAGIWNKYIKVALIITDEHTNGICLEYIEQMKDSEWKIKIFENFEDAENWCLE